MICDPYGHVSNKNMFPAEYIHKVQKSRQEIADYYLDDSFQNRYQFKWSDYNNITNISRCER